MYAEELCHEVVLCSLSSPPVPPPAVTFAYVPPLWCYCCCSSITSLPLQPCLLFISPLRDLDC